MRRTVGPVNPETPDQISGPPAPTGPRTGRRLAIAGIAAAALAVGGVAVAQAATSNSAAPSGSPSASASPGAPGSSGAPDEDKRERGPFLAGTVVSASGSTITITDFQGFQRTIHTSSATTYSDGLTATPAAGTKIVAEGTVDSDKTSLAATRIAKLPDRAAGGRRFPGGHGHGFPGGGPGGRHGDDPDSSATPSPGGSGTPSPSTPSPSTPSPSPSASPSS
jgi:hypothetical protein